MAWTAPRTWVTGEVVTASHMNAHVRDNLLETAPAKVTTAGDIVYATGANALARLGKETNDGAILQQATGVPSWLPRGSAEQTLRMNSGGTAPEWATVSPFNLLRHVAGNWYLPPIFGVPLETRTLVADWIYAYPIYIPTTATYTRIAIDVKTLSAGNARLGIYNDTGGAPDTLLLTAGTVSTSPAGVKEITISQQLTGGTWYWLAIQSDNSLAVISAVDAAPNYSVSPWVGGTNVSSQKMGYSVSRAYSSGLLNPFGGAVGGTSVGYGIALKI